MSDIEGVPQLPGQSGEQADGRTAVRDESYERIEEAYEQLAGKVSDLESRLTSRVLTLEEEERRLRVREIAQRMSIRKWTGILAASVVFSMVSMLIWAKYTMGLWWLFFAPDVHSVTVIIAPTLSGTTIVVALLWGAFRRFKDDDPERVLSILPVNSAVNTYSGQA
jgi:hypothetical protein